MRRFARVLRRFADKIDPQPQIAYRDPYVMWTDGVTTATPGNVTFNWIPRG